MNYPKFVGLFWTAIVVILHGCSLVVDSQTKCESNADCKGGATCNQGLCVVYEKPPTDTPPAQIATLQIDGEATAVAGVPYRVEITAKDAEGKLVDPYLGTIVFSSGDPKVALPANYTYVVDDKGTHAFEVTFVTAGKQIVSVIDSEKSSVVGTKEIQINPGPAAKILVTGINNPYTRGTNSSVTLHVTDLFENIVTEYSGEVKFNSSDTNATLPPNYTFQPATDKGSHTFTNAIKLNTTGKQSVTVLDSKNSSLKGTQENISVTTGTPTKLVFKTQPFNVGIGLAISPAIQVEIRDQGDNLVEGEVTISIASGASGAALSGTKSVPTSTGTASFGNLSLDKAGYYALKASYGNISQTSNPFSVNDPCSSKPCVKPPTCKGTATLTTYPATCTVTGAGATDYKCSNVSTDTPCESGEACHENKCQTAYAPGNSDLLITEVMHTPSTGNPQWFEVQNLSGKLLNLAGIQIKFEPVDSESETYSVPNSPPLLLPANQYFVFGSAAGQAIAHSWGSAIALSNAGELKIISDTIELENLRWNSDFPTTTPGKSMALSPLATVKRSNGYASAWCISDGSAKIKNPHCPEAADTSAQIANVRETTVSTPNMAITNALVTYIMPVGSEQSGFFVQASDKGPALFVNIDPSTFGLTPVLAVGDEVSLEITEKATVEDRIQVSKATLSRSTQNNSVSGLAQDVSLENNLVSEVGIYESELINVTGKLTADPAGESNYLTAKISTTGYTNGDDKLLFRLPNTLQSELKLKTDCEIKLKQIPLWRSETTAFLTVWKDTDLFEEPTCPPAPE